MRVLTVPRMGVLANIFREVLSMGWWALLGFIQRRFIGRERLRHRLFPREKSPTGEPLPEPQGLPNFGPLLCSQVSVLIRSRSVLLASGSLRCSTSFPII